MPNSVSSTRYSASRPCGWRTVALDRVRCGLRIGGWRARAARAACLRAASVWCNDTGLDRRSRHAVELRALEILREHQPAGVVDVADSARAVAASTGQHDRDRPCAAVLGERPEEHVDRQRELLLAVALAQEQPAAGDDHLLLRRNQIDVVGFDRHAVFDEMDRQQRVPRQQFVHQALEVWRQVLDDDERHPGVFREVVEEAHERIEAAGGRADADDVLR